MAGARRKRRHIDTRLLVLLLAVCACTAVFAAVQLATGLRPYNEAGREYTALRERYAPEPTGNGEPTRAAPTAAEQAQDPAAVNPDYVGWLEIAGTDGGHLPNISYPVVQGADNDKYLTTTFEGHANKLGAIFLDYRCAGAFDAPHAILYGHNAKDGSMFGSLAALLELAPEDWPDITIITADGAALAYEIYAVRKTDIHDPAYRLDFADDAQLAAFAAEMNAPQDTARLLTLSTCTDGGSMDDRLLVLAALVE